MNEWGVVGVIVVVLGLVITIITPIIKLNTSITKLTVMMSNVTGDLGELTSKNSKSHARIHERLEGHDKHIADHDKRIHVLEADKKEKINGNQHY